MNPAKQFYSDHPTFHVAVDSIIFGFDQGELKLLIHKRQLEPAKGEWSLFGGFVQDGESLDIAASRILFELTGLGNIYMEELKTRNKTCIFLAEMDFIKKLVIVLIRSLDSDWIIR